MDTEGTLLAALHADPTDHACWLALADWLEEDGQLRRAEQLRLRLLLQDAEVAERSRHEKRLLELLDEGTRPVVPTLQNAAGIRMALIPAGSFWMGSPPGEPGRHHDEDPYHHVELTRPFYLSTCPVTQGQFQRVVGHNPSHFRTDGEGAPLVRGTDTSDFPVERVSWDDAVAFCASLSALPQERSAGRVYRLPSEAEWEYACRAGTSTLFHFGNSLSSDRANVDGDLPEGGAPRRPKLSRTCVVGSYPPNAFGLYDVHGNVWEWCDDWYDPDYYRSSAGRDPKGPASGTRRSLRGGGWFFGAHLCRSAYRYRYEPDAHNSTFGMRVAMERIG
jgi:uncharacterized protein (TIGR02996 family)